MTVQIEHRLPSVSEFMTLRTETDWGIPNPITTETVLKRSFSGVLALEEGRVIGMARTVGDGCLILYIQDVIISKSHRSQGIGRYLIQELLNEAAKTCLPSCTIGLFAATGQNGFYEKLGFGVRNKPGYGPGMHATLTDLMHFQFNHTTITSENGQLGPISDSKKTGIALAKSNGAA